MPVSGAWAATARSSWTSLEGKGLFVASADGSAAREIRSGPAASIAWSPSRDELALVCEHARSAVLVVGRDGTPIGRLDHAAEPAWLPDGSRLAYRRFRYDAAEPEYTAGEELHVASAAAVEQAQLTVPRRVGEWRGAEVRNVRTGAIRVRVTVKDWPEAVALTPAYVALLSRSSEDAWRAKSKTLRVFDLSRHAERSLRLGVGVADTLDAAGRWVVYSGGRSIQALDVRTGRTRLVARASSTPVGVSIEGRRVAWGEQRRVSRIRAVTLPR